jgi:hypothetical protein
MCAFLYSSEWCSRLSCVVHCLLRGAPSRTCASGGKHFMCVKPRTLLFVLLSFSYLLSSALAVSQAQQPTGEKNPTSGGASSSTAKTASSPAEDSKYLGSDTCKTCHEDLYNKWQRTAHWKTTLDTKGGPSYQGCEGCHGPGGDHVDGGGDKTKIFVFEKASAKEVSARCLTCHAGAHPNFDRSPHGHAKVSYTDCHSVHSFKSEASLLKVSQPSFAIPVIPT